MRLQLIRAAGILSGALGVGAGLWVMTAAAEPLPVLDFLLVVAMGLAAVMVAIASLQYARGGRKAYRRLEIGAWGLAIMAILTMPDAGRFFAPAALCAIVTFALAFSERRAAQRAGAPEDRGGP